MDPIELSWELSMETPDHDAEILSPHGRAVSNDRLCMSLNGGIDMSYPMQVVVTEMTRYESGRQLLRRPGGIGSGARGTRNRSCLTYIDQSWGFQKHRTVC